MNEFDLIETVFAPLTHGFEGSFSLTDDAAIINAAHGFDLITTMDAICAGVHFLGSEDAALVAQKLLRVNMSDLAAMGAKPLAYLLSMQLPKDTDMVWVRRFAEGLAVDQQQFDIRLAGGDTCASLGLMSFSVTAFGTVPTGTALRRNGACVGDIIYVTGTLGDSALGLGLLQQNIAHPLSKPEEAWLMGRYLLPQPRLTFGQGLIGIAHSCMDISDGLVQDLGHICKASGVGAAIGRHLLPLSEGATTLTRADPVYWDAILGGGDDYELLFTVAPEHTQDIDTLAAAAGIPVSPIGMITEGHSVRVEDENEQLLSVPRKGFAHF